MFHAGNPTNVLAERSASMSKAHAKSTVCYIQIRREHASSEFFSAMLCYGPTLFTPSVNLTSRASANPAENAKMKKTDAGGLVLVIVLAISTIVITMSGCSRGEV